MTIPPDIIDIAPICILLSCQFPNATYYEQITASSFLQNISESVPRLLFGLCPLKSNVNCFKSNLLFTSQ